MLLKKYPKDFIVKEVMELNLEEGDYSYFLMKKKNYNTLKAIQTIARAWNLSLKNMGWAGNKDKKAITEQYISVRKNNLKELSLKDISLKFIGNGKEPISLGDLKGNNFEILIREADMPEKKEYFINFFGEQRFGGNNAEVGKALVKKDFKKACNLIGIDDSIPVKSLREIPMKMLRFYVHAYQSLLWNELAEKSEKEIIPILGFGTECDDYDEIMEREGINKRDFIIRQIPNLSCEGDERERVVKAENVSIEKNDEGILIKFFLPKGCYATQFIKQIFK